MSCSSSSLRPVLVLATTLAAGPVVTAGALAPVFVVAERAGAGPAAPAGLTLEQAVLGLCGAALLCGYVLWLLGLLLALAERFLDGRAAAAARRVPCPWVARALALTALGAALGVAAPASADPSYDARRAAPGGASAATVVAGLALPDRVATPAAGARASAALHEVVRGDTLWAVAAAALPPDAPAALVDRGWRRLAAANADVVDDPHLIFPGTVLRVPPLDDLLGKDQP